MYSRGVRDKPQITTWGGHFCSTKAQTKVPNSSWWVRKGPLEKGMFKVYFKGDEEGGRGGGGLGEDKRSDFRVFHYPEGSYPKQERSKSSKKESLNG